MSNRVLFVCAANVCRSPFMAATFLQEDSRGAGTDGGAGLIAVSRGISVVREHQMCRLAASLLDADTPGSASAAAHVSTQIAQADLEEADLVIVASREERGLIARMRPDARGRTFTLKEGVALGEPPLDSAERRRFDADDDLHLETLAAFAAFLDQRRGRIQLAPAPRARFPWSSHDDPRDVPDVHHDSTRRHTRVLKESRELVRALHRQIRLSVGAHA